MKKFYLAMLVSFTLLSASAETKYWVGTIGNYSDGANWNTQSNGSGIAGVPINTDDLVINRNATITIDGNYSPASLTITNNAIVNFANAVAARAYIISGGAVSPSFLVNAGCTFNITGTAALNFAFAAGSTGSIFGTVDVTGTSSRVDGTFGGGVLTVKSGGKVRYGGTSSNGSGSISTLILEANSTYEVYKNGGSFPTANYHPQSLLLNTGAVGNAAIFLMSSSTGSYGNYEFNSPAYTSTTNGINQNVTVNNFTLTDDGVGNWVFSTSNATPYTFTVNGNLNQAVNTTIDINRAASGSQATTLLIKGNVNSSGIITETNNNTGAVIELGGTNPSNFNVAGTTLNNDVSLVVNKSPGVNIICDNTILPNSTNAKLVLTSGNLDVLTNDKSIFVINPDPNAIVGGSIGSHIIGRLTRSTNQVAPYVFPVSNNATQLAKVVITPSNSNTTGWEATFIAPNPNSSIGLTPGSIDIVTNYYWEINRLFLPTPADAGNITFHYNELTSPSVLIPSQLKVVNFDGVSWKSLGGIDNGGNINNTLGSLGGAAPGDPINDFGSFALGGTVGVLPFGIEYLTGVNRNSDHAMQWKVNCSNNREVTMTLERSSDGRKFTNIHSIIADELRCREAFDYTDTDPLTGTNYYRIKLTGINGESIYSNIVVLLNKSAGLVFAGVQPNPVTTHGQAVLNIANTRNETVDIVVTNAEGRKVVQWRKALIAGSNRIPVNLGLLPAGSYQVTIVTAQERVTQSFIKL